MANQPDAKVDALQKLCGDVALAAGRGDLPSASMADFKRVMDEARLRLWASSESAKSGDPEWAQEFWLQWAADMCLAATQQLEDGSIDRGSAPALQLRTVAEQLAASLKKGG